MKKRLPKTNKTEINRLDIRTNGKNCQEIKRSKTQEREKNLEKKISKEFQRDIGRGKKQYYNDICMDTEDGNRQGK